MTLITQVHKYSCARLRKCLPREAETVFPAGVVEDWSRQVGRLVVLWNSNFRDAHWRVTILCTLTQADVFEDMQRRLHGAAPCVLSVTA